MSDARPKSAAFPTRPSGSGPSNPRPNTAANPPKGKGRRAERGSPRSNARSLSP